MAASLSPAAAERAIREPASDAWVECAELISLCARRLRNVIADRAGPRGVGETQFSLLWVCRLAPPAGLGQNQIAAALAVSPAQVSALVEQSRAAGLLVGGRDPSDRRRQVWRLTPAGHAIVEDVARELAPVAVACDARQAESGLEALRDGLRAWSAVLARHAAEAGGPQWDERKLDGPGPGRAA